ncbi:hypothetical protein SAMN05444743_10228 [Pseudomonas sp. PDC86]|jgi:uncharacterized membrane protein|nr:hypothetical protein SAMN05444743_10228 [Pseudomonas sp. PDC86]
MIISIQYLYWLAGVLLLITAGMILLDRSHPKPGPAPCFGCCSLFRFWWASACRRW